MEFNLEPHFVNIIAALAPAIAYVLVFSILKGIYSLPPRWQAAVKAAMPMVGPVLSLVLNYIAGQVDNAPSMLLAAAWGGLATIVYEIQKGLEKVKIANYKYNGKKRR